MSYKTVWILLLSESCRKNNLLKINLHNLLDCDFLSKIINFKHEQFIFTYIHAVSNISQNGHCSPQGNILYFIRWKNSFISPLTHCETFCLFQQTLIFLWHWSIKSKRKKSITIPQKWYKCKQIQKCLRQVKFKVYKSFLHVAEC